MTLSDPSDAYTNCRPAYIPGVALFSSVGVYYVVPHLSMFWKCARRLQTETQIIVVAAKLGLTIAPTERCHRKTYRKHKDTHENKLIPKDLAPAPLHGIWLRKELELGLSYSFRSHVNLASGRPTGRPMDF